MTLGFDNAPVAKSLSAIVFLLTLILGDRSEESFSFDLRRIFEGELWRFFTGFLVFDNLTQAFFGLILLYNLNAFERQMGSRKFGSFVAFSWAVTVVFCSTLTIFCSLVGAVLAPASGPYFLIFAQIAFYYKYVPKLQSSQYRLLGLDFSAKTIIYLLALQLMLNRGAQSTVAAVAGLVAGLVYDRDGYGFQRMRLPPFLETPFRAIGRMLSYVTPSFSSPDPADPATIAARQQRGQGDGGQGDDGVPRSAAGANPFSNPFLRNRGNRGYDDSRIRESPFELPPPDEESISMLVGMGFERSEVIAALRMCGNNVDAAANMLLR